MAVITTKSGTEIPGPNEISLILQDRTKMRDPINTGTISLVERPLRTLGTDKRNTLEERLQMAADFIPDDVEDLSFNATDIYFAGFFEAGRAYFVSGSPFITQKNKKGIYPMGIYPIGEVVQSFYMEQALNFEDAYAKQKDFDEMWIPVYGPDNSKVAVLRPSYVQGFLSDDRLAIDDLRVFLERDITQVKGKPGNYKIKGKIKGREEDDSFGEIDTLFGRAADVDHEDIKFAMNYAKMRDFDIIPHIEKEAEDKTQTAGKIVVIPASHEGFNKRRLLYSYTAGVLCGVGIIAGVVLYHEGCDFRGGYKGIFADTETAEKPKEAAEKHTKEIIENPEAKARSLEENVKSDKTAIEKKPVSGKKDDTKIKREPVPGREARVRPAVKRAPRARTAVDTKAPDDTIKTKAPASEGEYTYLPPVREGDSFYEEFRDSIDSYLNECVNSGKSGTSGAFTYSYVVNVHGKVVRAVVSEGNPRTQIPTRCAEGLREIMKRQTLETASDGIYTSTEIIELGGVE